MKEHMEIYKIFEEEVINDYFTANVKAEVIIDTILTPVIGEVLTVVCMKKGKIKGEMKLLAKEFPIKESETFRSRNADYLMHDDKFVYFVELKTTQGSYRDEQMEKYIEDCGSEDTFAKKLGKDFIFLLKHVSKTGTAGRKLALEKKLNLGVGDLQQLFETIITNPKEAAIKEGCKKQETHAFRAMCYLQSEKAVSSKKYLFTAGQMLDRMEDGNWWNYNIKLIYLIPKELGEDSDDIIYVTFGDIIACKDDIGRELEKKDSDLKNYWKWVVGILERCMVCNVKLQNVCSSHKECGWLD